MKSKILMLGFFLIAFSFLAQQGYATYGSCSDSSQCGAYGYTNGQCILDNGHPEQGCFCIGGNVSSDRFEPCNSNNGNNSGGSNSSNSGSNNNSNSGNNSNNQNNNNNSSGKLTCYCSGKKVTGDSGFSSCQDLCNTWNEQFPNSGSSSNSNLGNNSSGSSQNNNSNSGSSVGATTGNSESGTVTCKSGSNYKKMSINSKTNTTALQVNIASQICTEMASYAAQNSATIIGGFLVTTLGYELYAYQKWYQFNWKWWNESYRSDYYTWNINSFVDSGILPKDKQTKYDYDKKCNELFDSGTKYLDSRNGQIVSYTITNGIGVMTKTRQGKLIMCKKVKQELFEQLIKQFALKAIR